MRILIVEDEKSLREILQKNLQEEKYLVDIVADGDSGLFLATTNNYDVIILDYGLPKLDGKEVCREIRRCKINTPIIMLTGRTQPEDMLEMFELGVDDYIKKPFLFAELLARINAVLRRPKAVESGVIKIDNLLLEVDSRKVIRGGKTINLTPKEFQILVYLVKNMGKLVSLEDLLNNVWDMNADMFSKTVKTHIMNLRKKVDGGHKKKLIQTINRSGYIIKK